MPVAVPCYGLALIEPAVVVRPFAPIGMFGGHWGIDLAESPESDVLAVGSGTVSFAGSVATRRSVTIDHGGGIRTSYSYLAGIRVSTGERVTRGSTVGSSGYHDGRQAFHLSLRSGTTYLDPYALARCSTAPRPGLWLAVSRSRYPVMRDRNPRRNIRPSSHCSSRDRPCRVRATRSDKDPAHAGR